MTAVWAPWADGGGGTLKVAAVGRDEAWRVTVGWLVVAVTVVGPGGTAIVGKFEAAVINGGDCSGGSSVEAGERLLVFRVASWLVPAGGAEYCRN